MSVHQIETWFSEDLADNSRLPAFSWPGCYVMAYVTECGDLLCAECATKEFLAWQDNGGSDDPPAGFLSYGNTTDYPETVERCEECNVVIINPSEA